MSRMGPSCSPLCVPVVKTHSRELETEAEIVRGFGQAVKSVACLIVLDF